MVANNNLNEAQLKLYTDLFHERQKLLESCASLLHDYDYWKEIAVHYRLAYYMLSSVVYHYAPSRENSNDEWIRNTIKYYRKHIGPDGEVKIMEPSCEACQRRKEHPIIESFVNAILENDKIGASLEFKFYPEIMYDYKFPDDELTGAKARKEQEC